MCGSSNSGYHYSWYLTETIKKIVVTENMIIGILSIFIGIQGGLVFSNFFFISHFEINKRERSLFILANRSDYRYNRNVYHFIFNRFYIYTNVYSYSKNSEAY